MDEIILPYNKLSHEIYNKFNPPLETPVLFLIFNRPHTAQEVFNSIKSVKPKKLYVATDGPRKNHLEDIELCQKSKDILKQIDWDCELHIHFLEENLGGCDFALRYEISWFFENEERGIILEDDIVPNTDFFYFCELLLKKYQNNQKVMMISGSNPVSAHNMNINTSSDYYFSRWASIWGWATWKDRWQKLAIDYPNSKEVLNAWYHDPYFRNSHAFQELFGRQYEYFADHPNESPWDLQWCYTLEMYNGLCVVPSVNLITNIGQFGYHSNDVYKSNPLLYLPTKDLDVSKIRHPTAICSCSEYDKLRFNQYVALSKIEYMVLCCGYCMRKIGLSRHYYSLIRCINDRYHKYIKK